jgi:uncharacterized protein YneF (UPF0154 family)
MRKISLGLLIVVAVLGFLFAGIGIADESEETTVLELAPIEKKMVDVILKEEDLWDNKVEYLFTKQTRRVFTKSMDNGEKFLLVHVLIVGDKFYARGVKKGENTSEGRLNCIEGAVKNALRKFIGGLSGFKP